MTRDLLPRLPKPLVRGGYRARFAETRADLKATQRLRHICFVEAAGRPSAKDGLDRDQFDAVCDHMLIEDTAGRLVCCCRVQVFDDLTSLQYGYTAEYYGLDGLKDFDFSEGAGGSFLELGRFCVAHETTNADVLRLAWGMLARIVDLRGVAMIFGCSSFIGCDPKVYSDAFALLASRYISGRITAKADETINLSDAAGEVTDPAKALAQVPTLLRSYLTMGGWVSDHAVVDRKMNTLHVFTGLEVASIPEARARALREIAR